MTIDGVRMVFQMTPGTEAPAEMNTLFPQFKSVWMAENANHTLHNVLTLRGAQVRDPLIWSQYLDRDDRAVAARTSRASSAAITGRCGITHGSSRSSGSSSALYKYIHDQAVRLLNEGYTGVEISNMIELPPELSQEWFNRGYYGSVKHNTRAVYQRYMGFYDANPSTLDELPPAEAAAKYVEYMGGADAILKKARADFDKGDYRWVGDGAQARRVRRSGERRGQGAARRRLRADGVPGGIGSVALGLPARRV